MPKLLFNIRYFLIPLNNYPLQRRTLMPLYLRRLYNFNKLRPLFSIPFQPLLKYFILNLVFLQLRNSRRLLYRTYFRPKFLIQLFLRPQVLLQGQHEVMRPLKRRRRRTEKRHGHRMVLIVIAQLRQ